MVHTTSLFVRGVVRLRVGSVVVDYDVYPCGRCEGRAMQVRLSRDRRLWSEVVSVRGMGIERYVGARGKEKRKRLEAPVAGDGKRWLRVDDLGGFKVLLSGRQTPGSSTHGLSSQQCLDWYNVAKIEPFTQHPRAQLGASNKTFKMSHRTSWKARFLVSSSVRPEFDREWARRLTDFGFEEDVGVRTVRGAVVRGRESERQDDELEATADPRTRTATVLPVSLALCTLLHLHLHSFGSTPFHPSILSTAV